MTFTNRKCNAVLNEVLRERRRQEEKWGEQNHPSGTGVGHVQQLVDGMKAEREKTHGLATLGEYARNLTDALAKGGGLTYSEILWEEVCEAMEEADSARLRLELVQVAAVAVAWVERLDRAALAAKGET